MAFHKKIKSVCGAGLLVIAMGGASAEAAPALGRFMPILGETNAPSGHMEFCDMRPGECSGPDGMPVVVKLDGERWEELVQINMKVNKAVRPTTDQAQFGVSEFWTYPTDGAGDCEEYVLEKRRILMENGWPKSALLITVVKDTKNEGHAVLSVRTDQGDLILDNQMQAILPWYSTPYRFVKRQSSRHPAKWAAISDRRVSTVASISE
ncbi:transglutaminase-like cysteine peptidase [Pseudovibrio sp. SPO723]|uniref:transglutaminase-like cysteine peptidase n=1 Tax=Nesiotobacter zosterae TaxID=392721 RepID=UPI0029C4EA68|nr:transglutaminase-like cysteine peptidase [Pseudovibrio sp. SPO723]MDX5594618.1 transglutaminase-like cysteine peptidase [Pseudovibrio sp. SPO723]